MRFSQLYNVLQDTITTDELMFFIPAISSNISRASSSNVHFMTQVIFLPIAPLRTRPLTHYLYPALKQPYNQGIVAYEST